MKKEKAKEISELVESFCNQYFDEELAACSSRLCDKLSRSRKLDITRGKQEIWAASIVYVIARVNFLFDKANNNFLTSDLICDFFNTKKTTTGNKATSIERTLNIGIGDENYCTHEITESFSLIRAPFRISGSGFAKWVFQNRQNVNKSMVPCPSRCGSHRLACSQSGLMTKLHLNLVCALVP